MREKPKLKFTQTENKWKVMQKQTAVKKGKEKESANIDHELYHVVWYVV